MAPEAEFSQERALPLISVPERPLRTRAAEIPAMDAAARRAAEPAVRFPGTDHPLTRRYIERYSQGGQLKWLAATLKAGDPYLAFIRQEIERRGLPPYLLYLPVIESGFVPSALSRSGASGLWQFMRNSVRPYLQINEWLDERRDFYKSTQAALSKLEENYKTFGDWYLALAAYNSGAGEIARVIKQTGCRDYWELNEKNRLKKETSVYVPKLLAVYTIASDPRRYGLDVAFSNEIYDWQLVPVRKQVDITMLAEFAGLDKETLRRANRELLFNITPPVVPGKAPYMLKVRKESAAHLGEVLSRDDLPLLRNYIHVINSGDTLSALALRYGVRVETILENNAGVRPEALQLGTRLLIPALHAPHSEKSRSAEVPAAAAAAPPPASGGAGQYRWVVRKGDTLFSIAQKHGVGVEALAAANGMRLNDTLSIGRTLLVPRRQNTAD
jgi:membrane-bound lytic murein transglycosylase D